MTDMFVSLGTWNWLIFGFILMALEVLAPGVFLFWLGLAALLVGLISFAVADVLADPARDVRDLRCRRRAGVAPARPAEAGRRAPAPS